MSDSYGYFAPAVADRPIPPPPPYPPAQSPLTPPPPPIGSYHAGMTLSPGGRVAVSDADFDEQLMMHGATMTSYANMGKSSRPGYYPVAGRMGWGERFWAGVDLAKTCWTVLRDEPMLLVVPLMTLLASVIVIVPLLLLSGGPADPQADRVLAGIQAVAVGLVVAVLGNLGSAVVVSAATTRLEGLRPDLGTSWKATMARLPQLTGLAVIMVAERAITGALRETPWGRFLADLLDRSWDFASFLSIPVILFEGAQPFGAVKRSGELVISRWGTQLTARGVLHLAVFVCALPLLLAMVLLGWLFSPVVAMVMFVVWLLLVVAVSTALNGILSAAMYRFAVTGLVVPGFREADMWRMFSRAT